MVQHTWYTVLYFQDFLKLKYFSTMWFSSLMHLLFSEQQDIWQGGTKQMGCVYIPRFPPLLQAEKTVTALSVVAPKLRVPSNLNASPWRNLPFPFSTHDRSKPPQNQIHKVTSEVWQLHTCKQQNKPDLSLSSLLYAYKLSSWNSKNLTVLHPK